MAAIHFSRQDKGLYALDMLFHANSHTPTQKKSKLFQRRNLNITMQKKSNHYIFLDQKNTGLK